jgi:hypothetical protein
MNKTDAVKYASAVPPDMFLMFIVLCVIRSHQNGTKIVISVSWTLCREVVEMFTIVFIGYFFIYCARHMEKRWLDLMLGQTTGFHSGLKVTQSRFLM